MNEGIFRVLRTLVRGPKHLGDLSKAAGEAESVVRDALRRHPKFFDNQDSLMSLTPKGVYAIARELVERTVEKPADDENRMGFRQLAHARPSIRRDLDQVWANDASVFMRAQFLIESGDVQRGLAFLGDDDLTSAALFFLGVERKVSVFEIDPALVSFLSSEAEDRGWALDISERDLFDPADKKMKGRFGAVFLDPPYAPRGFAHFLNRAIEMTKDDGRILIAFGGSRRAKERIWQKQALIHEAGLVVREMKPDFCEYEGANSIGSRSDLWIVEKSPKTKLIELPDGQEYTRSVHS